MHLLRYYSCVNYTGDIAMSMEKATVVTVSMRDISCHAQTFMKSIGASYGIAVPQSIADCWQFYMCEYDTEKMPDFVRIDAYVDPFKRVGWGLSEENATEIDQWIRDNQMQEQQK